jgi:hypothetical protein
MSSAAAVLAVLLLGGGALPTIAAAAAALIRPEWAAPLGGASGAECVDHSAAHSPKGGVQNNTRWTHWAVPRGEPPPSGWPLIVTFEVGGFYPVEGSPQENDTCGDGWHQRYGPPDDPVCTAYLERRCGDVKTNHTLCQQCINQIPSKRERRHNCTEYQPYGFCPRPPGGGYRHRSQHGPFSPVPTIYNRSFFENMSYNPHGGGGGFSNANAGELWLQRTRQYTLANGIAWLVLNPFEMDSWDWDTDADWEHGLDQPFLKKLFADIRSGAYPANRSGHVAATAADPRGSRGPGPLFDADRIIPLGWSAGAQMASWMIEVRNRGGGGAALFIKNLSFDQDRLWTKTGKHSKRPALLHR